MNAIRMLGAAALLSLSVSLLAEPRIAEEHARATALSKVPGGKVKSEELEKEHGRLIWSFDIAEPSSTDVTEVNVDAETGELSVKRETPAEENKEAHEERD